MTDEQMKKLQEEDTGEVKKNLNLWQAISLIIQVI